MFRIIILIFTIVVLTLLYVFIQRLYTPTDLAVVQISNVPTSTLTPTPTVNLLRQGAVYEEIPQKTQVYQTFNNCGPASLAMLLSYHGNNISQQVLGNKLRPYQVPNGDNDDKSVTVTELAREAEATYGLVAYHRPNGTVDLIKKFIANGMPVLVRTWLHPGEDIGHYRIIRGYDDQTQEIIQDDSYEGQNLRYSYDVFSAMWQPFNYEYLVLVKPEQIVIADAVIGEDKDVAVSWNNAYIRAQQEYNQNTANPYPLFNQSIALFYMGQFERSVEIYEQVVASLPSRMLWYQTEPIKAYFETGRYDEVFSLTENILNNQNRAFSELYLIRGESYLMRGDRDSARAEFETAIFYNINLPEAREALSKIAM